jgi:pyruvate dehydrogenase E2 component (dihydrolipoamide acetyltransferase)
VNVDADVVLPNLGFGMEEGRLISWLKKPGDPIRKGEAIAEIEGDKATVELEAVVDGVLHEVLVEADTVVPIGTVLARIRAGGSAAPATPTPPPASEAARSTRPTPVAERMAREHGIDLSAVSATGPGGRITREDVQAAIDQSNGKREPSPGKVLAAPAVRKLARDHDIDLHEIRGTGRDGHVTRADVEAVLAETPTAPLPSVQPDGERREVILSPMRKAIARLMAQSTQEAPHFYVTAELDLTHTLNVLPKDIGINSLLLYVTVQTLKDVPELNATYEEGRLYQYSTVNLAVAVALDKGLISPVIQHADDFSLSALATRSRNLITRARDGRLQVSELGGGTFTVSNLGVVKQVERFTAIITPPQIGVLAVGAAKDRPVVIDGGLHVRKTVHLTLSADHRIVDGLVAARFLEAFDKRLQTFAG